MLTRTSLLVSLSILTGLGAGPVTVSAQSAEGAGVGQILMGMSQGGGWGAGADVPVGGIPIHVPS